MLFNHTLYMFKYIEIKYIILQLQNKRENAVVDREEKIAVNSVVEEKCIFIMNNDTMTNDCVNFVYDVFHKRKNA